MRVILLYITSFFYSRSHIVCFITNLFGFRFMHLIFMYFIFSEGDAAHGIGATISWMPVLDCRRGARWILSTDPSRKDTYPGFMTRYVPDSGLGSFCPPEKNASYVLLVASLARIVKLLGARARIPQQSSCTLLQFDTSWLFLNQFKKFYLKFNFQRVWKLLNKARSRGSLCVCVSVCMFVFWTLEKHKNIFFCNECCLQNSSVYFYVFKYIFGVCVRV